MTGRGANGGPGSPFAAAGLVILMAVLYVFALMPGLTLYYLALSPGTYGFMAAYLAWAVLYCVFSMFLSVPIKSDAWRFFLLCPIALLILFHAISFGAVWGDPASNAFPVLFHCASLFVLCAAAISILMKIAAGNRPGF